jgi:hypothetical protein
MIMDVKFINLNSGSLLISKIFFLLNLKQIQIYIIVESKESEIYLSSLKPFDNNLCVFTTLNHRNYEIKNYKSKNGKKYLDDL